MDSLNYIDFLPRCLDDGGIFSEARYERFGALVTRANDWLHSHGTYRIVTCESVEMKQKSGAYVNPEKMSFFEYGKHITRYIRALRLWFRPILPNESPEPQQIHHLNILPAKLGQEVFSKPKFENLAQTLERANAKFRSSPLRGYIINIETQDMKCHKSTGSADPDECSWRETGNYGCYFVMVLRIFYASGPPAYEEIGTADFVPRSVRGSREAFASNIRQARSWMNQQQGIRFINVQSIDYKLKKDWGSENLDTHRTAYFEQGKGYTRYVRIIRVYYGRASASMCGSPPPMPMPALNYKTFVPVLLSTGLGSPVYETMSKTWQRAKAWLRAANVSRYLSVETVPVRLYSGHQHGNHEVTYTRNNGNRNEYWLFVIRLYIEGAYQEPPPDALPHVPKAEDDCCAIL